MGERERKGALRRVLGFRDVVMLGVGGVLGAGTYAIIGEATGLAGAAIWMSLLIAAVAALLCAGVYAELVSRYPDAGGGYEFIARGFGRRFANVCGLLLFVTGVVAAATIAIAFSQYLGRLVDVPVRIAAPSVIVLMGAVNIFGIRGASWFNIGATVVTLLGLAFVIVASAPAVGTRDLMEMSDAGIAGIFGGAAMAFFAYVGFEDVIKSVEETKEPRTTMPRALLTSGVIVLIVNVAIGLTSVSAIAWDDLSGADGPLSRVLAQQWGDIWGVVLTGIALVAMSKTILSNVLGGSRLVYDMGRDTDWMPDALASVWDRTGAPVLAIVLATVLAMAVSLIGDLGLVATMSNLAVLTLFTIVNLALIRIRRNEGDDVDVPFRLPFNVARVSMLNVLALAMVLLLGAFNVFYLLSR